MKQNIFEDLAIVVAVKNGDKTIRQCLESLSVAIDQGAVLYIFDSLSSDNTRQIANSVYPNANYFYEKDDGLYHAWNKAIDIVSERFLFFINCDDSLYSFNNLETLLNLLENDQSLVASSGKTVMTRKDGVERCAGNKLTRDWFIGNMPIVTPATVFSVKALRSIGGFDTHFSISADYDMALRLLKKYTAKRFAFQNLKLVRFSLDGMSNVNHSKAFAEIRIIIFKRLGIFKYLYHIAWYFIYVVKRLLLSVYLKL